MIWTIRTELQRYLEEWSADIEIDSSSTLEQLHIAIQDAVEFNNDHLFTFYIARTDRSRDRKFLDDGDGNLYDVTLYELFPLETRKSLFYWFDFGDDWMFKVTKTRKSPHDPQAGVVYPRVVAEEGTKPEQYPGYDELACTKKSSLKTRFMSIFPVPAGSTPKKMRRTMTASLLCFPLMCTRGFKRLTPTLGTP